jgi:hypothetical protein
MKNRRKYLTIAGFIIIFALLIAGGLVLSNNRLNKQRAVVLNYAYVSYALLNEEVMLCGDSLKPEDISVDSLIKDYGIGGDDEFFIKAEVSKKDGEYYISFFDYYDCKTKTAFVYNEETAEMDMMRGKGFTLKESEVIFK